MAAMPCGLRSYVGELVCEQLAQSPGIRFMSVGLAGRNMQKLEDTRYRLEVSDACMGCPWKCWATFVQRLFLLFLGPQCESARNSSVGIVSAVCSPSLLFMRCRMKVARTL